MNLSRISILIAALALIGGAALHAQNPESDALRARLAAAQADLAASADLMPAARYGQEPTSARLAFADRMLRLAGSNEMMCALVGASDAPRSAQLDAAAPKAAIVARVRNSLKYCSRAFGTLTDARLADPIRLFGWKSDRGTAAVILATEWSFLSAEMAADLRGSGSPAWRAGK